MNMEEVIILKIDKWKRNSWKCGYYVVGEGRRVIYPLSTMEGLALPVAQSQSQQLPFPRPKLSAIPAGTAYGNDLLCFTSMIVSSYSLSACVCNCVLLQDLSLSNDTVEAGFVFALAYVRRHRHRHRHRHKAFLFPSKSQSQTQTTLWVGIPYGRDFWISMLPAVTRFFPVLLLSQMIPLFYSPSQGCFNSSLSS